MCTGGRRDKPRLAKRFVFRQLIIRLDARSQSKFNLALGSAAGASFILLNCQQEEKNHIDGFVIFSTRFVSPRWPHDSVSRQGFLTRWPLLCFLKTKAFCARTGCGSVRPLVVDTSTNRLMFWVFSKKPRRFKSGLLMKCERLLLWIVLSDKGIAKSVSSVSHC